MVYVPSGTLQVGVGDEDLQRILLVARPKTISVRGFFMDDTEITNNEYRQFVNWVRDSLAHRKAQERVVEESENDQQPPQNIIDWEQEIGLGGMPAKATVFWKMCTTRVTSALQAAKNSM
jgi:formylglycine-generating enzyme required for sulfatase activity